VTARLAIHDDVAASTDEVLARLGMAGVDVEVTPEPPGDASASGNPLLGLEEDHVDLAVVGIWALRGASGEGLTMLAVLPREDPRDVLVCVGGTQAPLRDLRRGARVAVSGARRAALLLAHRADAEVVPVTGAMDVQALAEDGVDAAVMWSGEARRAGLSPRATELLDARSWPPDPGRGAVAIVGRHPIAEVTGLDHLPTRTALRAELALVDALDLPAGAPLGSLAQPSGRIMRLWAAIASEDGRRVVRADLTGPLDEPEQLGVSVARELEARGAEIVLTGSTG
jgi:hydroxymethylbilane synthase